MQCFAAGWGLWWEQEGGKVESNVDSFLVFIEELLERVLDTASWCVGAVGEGGRLGSFFLVSVCVNTYERERKMHRCVVG